MKKLLVISAVLAVVSLFSSCVNEVKDPEVNPGRLEFTREGGSKTFQLIADADWRLSVNGQDTNVEVSLTSGAAGTYEITVTLSENKTFNEYSGALTIDQNKKLLRVPITQAKTNTPSIGSITPFVLTGGEKTVTISAQWSWALIDTTEVFPAWLDMDIKEGTGVNGQPVSTQVTLTAQELPEGSPTRTHTLFFRMDQGQWSERVMSLEVEQLNDSLDVYEGDWIANQWKPVDVGGGTYVDMFTSDEVFFIKYNKTAEQWDMEGDWTDRNGNPIYKFEEFDATTYTIRRTGEPWYSPEFLAEYSEELADYTHAIFATGEEHGVAAGRLLLASPDDPAGVEVPYFTVIGMDLRDETLSYWITGTVNGEDQEDGVYSSGVPALVKLNAEGRLEICDPWHPQGTINGFWYDNELPDGSIEWIAVTPAIWVIADLTALGEVNSNGDGWFALSQASLSMSLFFRPDDLEGRRTGDVPPDPDYPKPTSKAAKSSIGKKLSKKAQIAPTKYKVIGFGR